MSCFWEKQLKLSLQLGLLLIAALAWCIPARATIAKVQDPAATRCTAASGQCLQTVTATGSGHLLEVLVHKDGGTGTVSSCCNAGCPVAWTQGPNQSSVGGAAEQWYCLSSSSGATSIGPTWSANCGANGCETEVREFSTDQGGFQLNSGATPKCQSTATGANPTECSLTVSSVNSVYSINISTAGSTTVCSQSYTCTFPNANGEGYKINQTSYTASQWTMGSATYGQTAMAIEEISGGATTIGLDKRRRYEALEGE